MPVPLHPGQVYHVYNHANGEENLFREETNHHYFLEKYQTHVYPVAETFAYCLLTNHLHLMVRVRKEDVLREFFISRGKDLTGFQNLSGLISRQFSNLFNAYAKAYNKKYDRSGSLFQRPFKRKPITNRTYYINLIAYIHLNPVHHGFTKEPDDWPFSSWHAYLSNRKTKVSREAGLDWFVGKGAFRELHKELKSKDVMLEFE